MKTNETYIDDSGVKEEEPDTGRGKRTKESADL